MLEAELHLPSAAHSAQKTKKKIASTSNRRGGKESRRSSNRARTRLSNRCKPSTPFLRVRGACGPKVKTYRTLAKQSKRCRYCFLRTSKPPTPPAPAADGRRRGVVVPIRFPDGTICDRDPRCCRIIIGAGRGRMRT
jgi:hypothetical protein